MPEMSCMKKGSHAEHPGRAVDDKAEGAGAPVGERTRRAVRPPSDLVRDGENARPGLGRHARLVVEGERHGRLRDARAARDIGDRRTFHAMPFVIGPHLGRPV
jgi:hypothetical protein